MRGPNFDSNGTVPLRRAHWRLVAVLAAVLMVVSAAGAVAAQSLDALRASGTIAERFDGYVMVRGGSADASAKALVDEVNAKRRAIYEKRAKEEIARLKDAKKAQKKSSAKDLKSALAEFAEQKGIRHVRLTKTESSFVPIRDGDGRAYKGVSTGDNHRVEIYALRDGEWRAEGITLFDACRGVAPKWRSEHPDARLVMAVHKNDLLRCERDGGEGIFRVVKLAPTNGTSWLAGHTEAGNLQARHDDPDDPFRWYFLPFSQLKRRKGRMGTGDVLGRVHDPGHPG